MLPTPKEVGWGGGSRGRQPAPLPLPCYATVNSHGDFIVLCFFFHVHCLCNEHFQDKCYTLTNNSYLKGRSGAGEEGRYVFTNAIFIMECVLSEYTFLDFKNESSDILPFVTVYLRKFNTMHQLFSRPHAV